MVFRLFSSIFALIFLAILFIIFSHFNAFAQNIANEQNILLNNQIQQSIEQERKNIIRQKEIEEIKKGHEKTFKPQEAEVKNKDELCLIENACRIIQDFEIKGASVYSSEKLYKKFAKKYRETCLTKFDLNDMNKAINQFYLENGFVLARVYFDLAKLVESGIVIIVIEEGKIDKITLRDNSKLNDFLPFRRSLQKNTAFFGISESDEYDDKSGDVFNLRDFEQGLDQINRLGSQNAKMQIEPAQKAGYSNIIIDNEIGDLATLSFTLDNSGNARSGRIKQKFALNQDNFISVNDNIYANYSQSNTGNKSRYSRSLYSSFSMPLGYYTLGASYSYSEYKITTSGVADTIRNFGNTESKNFYVERVLARGQKYKTNLKFDLDLMDTDNYIEDAYQEPSSYNLTVAGISLNNIFYLKKGTLFLQAKYNRGLDKFGAKKDGTGLGDNLPRAQFDSFGLYGQFGRYFNITPNLPLEYKLTFDSLYSKDSLYGQRKIAIGGLYTVRGFNENVISGDKGYYFRNDFKINVGNLVSNIFRGENNGEDGFEKFANATSFKLYNNDFSLMNFLNKTSFGVFYDYGYVRNKVVDDFNDEGYMSGIGAGLTYYHKNFNASLTYSYGLHSPKFLENINLETQDKETIYFSITYNFGL